jgi:hypothetical protein
LTTLNPVVAQSQAPATSSTVTSVSSTATPTSSASPSVTYTSTYTTAKTISKTVPYAVNSSSPLWPRYAPTLSVSVSSDNSSAAAAPTPKPTAAANAAYVPPPSSFWNPLSPLSFLGRDQPRNWSPSQSIEQIQREIKAPSKITVDCKDGENPNVKSSVIIATTGPATIYQPQLTGFPHM